MQNRLHGALIGLLGGITIAFMMGLVAGLLCLTIIGLPLGLLVLVLSPFALIVGPIAGFIAPEAFDKARQK